MPGLEPGFWRFDSSRAYHILGDIMAKPILATPTLKGKDAERLLKEIEQTPQMSKKTKAELERCLFLYKQFYRRGLIAQ